MFRQMMKMNPHLAGYNEETVQEYYAALKWADPEIAEQPTVAAGVITGLLMTSDPERAAIPHRDVFQTLWPIYAARKGREARG